MIPQSTMQKFRESLRGQSFCIGDQGYDAARTLPNAMIDRKPFVIARCTGAADVIECVRFAREHALLVAVRGGGHSVAGKYGWHGGPDAWRWLPCMDLETAKHSDAKPEDKEVQQIHCICYHSTYDNNVLQRASLLGSTVLFF
jgi:FAD binding domain